MNWNCNSVSVICRVTWCIIFIIYPTIKNEFDINCFSLWTFFCKFNILSIKFNYAFSFSLLKLYQSWLHPPVSSYDSLTTNLLDFCAFGCLMFLIFVREAFLILLPLNTFKCFLVGGSLFNLSWIIFYPRLGSRSSPYFAINVVTRSDDPAYQLPFFRKKFTNYAENIFCYLLPSSLWNLLLSPATDVRFMPRQDVFLFVLGLLKKLNHYYCINANKYFSYWQNFRLLYFL